MGDLGDYWKDHKAHKQAVKSKYIQGNIEFIRQWAINNLFVFLDDMPGSQIRLYNMEVTIDIWPQWLKWHNITTGKRGQCRNQKQLKELLEGLLNDRQEI